VAARFYFLATKVKRRVVTKKFRKREEQAVTGRNEWHDGAASALVEGKI
jgi:hypothetical protein